MGQKGVWLEEMGQKKPQNEMWGGKNGWKNSVVGKKWVKRSPKMGCGKKKWVGMESGGEKWVKRSPKWVKRNTHMKCRVGKMGQKVV